MVRYGGHSANPQSGGTPPDCSCLEATLDIVPQQAACSFRCVLKHVLVRLLIAGVLCVWFSGFFFFILCIHGNRIVVWLPEERDHCDKQNDPLMLVALFAIWGGLAPLCLPCVIRPRKCMSEKQATAAGYAPRACTPARIFVIALTVSTASHRRYRKQVDTNVLRALLYGCSCNTWVPAEPKNVDVEAPAPALMQKEPIEARDLAPTNEMPPPSPPPTPPGHAAARHKSSGRSQPKGNGHIEECGCACSIL